MDGYFAGATTLPRTRLCWLPAVWGVWGTRVNQGRRPADSHALFSQYRATHLDRDHYHNHSFINRYHKETGKLTRDDLTTVRKLRSLNDQICKSYGLSIPQQAKQERQARVPKKVGQMIKVGRFSYLADTMQKADFA